MVDRDDERGKQDKPRRSNFKQICFHQLFSVVVFALGITGGILIGIYGYHGGLNGDGDTKVSQSANCGTNKMKQNGENVQTVQTPSLQHVTPTSKLPTECPNTNPIKDTNYENSIFAPLTMPEMNKAAQFLLDRGIISTLSDSVNLTENFILYQYINPPNKREALGYLDRGGVKPGRYAKVTVQRGGVSPPDIMEYKVGPFDADTMTVASITAPGDIDFNSRPYESLEVAIMTEMLVPDMMGTLAPLINESFDGANFTKDMYFNFFNGPPSTSGKGRDTRWNIGFAGFRHAEDVDLIHLLPLSGRVHNPGTNTSDWYTYDFHYLNQGPYNTSAELMDAYNNDRIRKVKLEKGYRNTLWDRVFPKRDGSKPLRKNADIPGPRAYNPGGPRYEINGTNVKWMDWNFDISGGQTRGPALFNIKFKNERIIYEHALNDISLNYAMDSHSQNNIIYADATYGILGGDYPTNIMSGVDCPEHGTVLNTSYWWHKTQKAYDMRSICIFEADGQEALWRHVGQSFEAGMRNRHLVVRVPVVVGNYDYTFDFHFHFDGKIFTNTMASGYIQASFWDEGNPNTDDKTRDAFGYRIGPYQTGPIHDHMFGFKVDMDIVDENNTFQVIKWKAGPALEAIKTQKNISKAPDYFIYNELRYLEWEKVEKERGISHTEDQQFWLVVNERHKNKWGVERGYQIAPLATGSQSLKEHPLLKALSFTKYHCAVTTRREDEPSITSIYDVNRMDNTSKNLDDRINNENIVDTDIVNWVTVGFLHIPTTEDMPMTVRVETGFMLRPFNFVDRTASFDMPQYTATRDRTFKEFDPIGEPCVESEANNYFRWGK